MLIIAFCLLFAGTVSDISNNYDGINFCSAIAAFILLSTFIFANLFCFHIIVTTSSQCNRKLSAWKIEVVVIDPFRLF